MSSSRWLLVTGLMIAYLREVACADSSSFLLENKAFGIRSRVSVDLNERIVNHVDEYYDPAQGRARISYGTEKELRREFYYEEYSDLGLETDHSQSVCKASSKHDIRVALMSNSDQVAEFFRLMDTETLRYQEHLVGPTSVLFLVAKHPDLVKPIPWSSELLNGNRLWRNLEASYYQMDYELGEKRIVRITLIYHANDAKNMEPSIIVKSMVPISVDMVFPDATLVVVDYFDHWIYPGAEYIKSKGADISTRDNLVIDLFSLPLHADCSFISDHVLVHKSPFKHLETGSIQYSFEVLTDELKGEKLHRQYVAFDGTTMEARLDSELYGEDIDNSMWLQGDTKVLDFNANRKSVIIEPRVIIPKDSIPSKKDDQDNELPVLGNESETSIGSHCVNTYIYPDGQDRTVLSRIEVFLFGVDERQDEMIYLGQSSVRGIRAQIFKARARYFPYWYGEPVVYKNNDGKLELRYKGRQLSGGSKSNSTLDNYYAIVYVSYDICPAPVVLLYELYETLTEVDGATSNRPVFRSTIYNFFWHLNEAPNGDSGLKLFDYRDICAKPDGQHIEVSISASTTEHLENINWILDPVGRDEAIRAQMRRLFDVPSLMLYDLESQLIGQNRVWIHFKVAEHKQLVLNVKFLNRADPLNEGGEVGILHTHVRTMSECLWMVYAVDGSSDKDLLRSRYILYFQEDQTCLVDYTAHGPSRMGGNYAIGAEGRGELFVVEPAVDTRTSLSHTWLNQGQDLKGRKVVIRSYDESMAMFDPVDVQLQLEEVRIRRLDHFDSHVGASSISPDAKVSLSGFRLLKNEFTRTINLTGEGEKKSYVDSSQCEAACLADFDCISYSYCEPNFDDEEDGSFDSTSGECRLSKLDFTKIKTDELAKLKQQISGYRKIVTFNSDLGPVELHRNHRCNVHRKRFIDLFLSRLPRRAVMNHEQVDVYQVESDEECAELCYARSTAAIKNSVGLTGKVNDLIRQDNGQLNLDKSRTVVIEQLRSEHKDLMRSFCPRYLYLDKFWSASQLKALQDAAQDSTGDATKQSFCALDRSKTAPRGQVVNSTQFIFDSYDFDFSKLYSQLAGYKMINSPKTDVEVSSLVELQTGATLTRKQLETLLSGLSQGKNYQIPVTSKTISQCARTCFQKLTYVWPSCRSFDIVVVSNETDGRLICLLNTAHIDRTKSLDMQQVLRRAEADEKVIHFELISQLVDSEFENEERLNEYFAIDKSLVANLVHSFMGWKKVFIVFAGVLTGFAIVRYGKNWFGYGLTESDGQLLGSELY